MGCVHCGVRGADCVVLCMKFGVLCEMQWVSYQMRAALREMRGALKFSKISLRKFISLTGYF